MCYSPEVDLVAGAVIGAVAVDAYRHADDRPTRVLAAVPAVLAAHQMIEAVAWWGLQGRVPATAGEVATTAYLIIAFGIVPALVPYAVWRSERSPARRRWMLPFVILGGVVGVVLLASLVTGPHSAEIGGRYLAYRATVPAGSLVAVAYVVGVCSPLLMSSHRRLVVFGALNVPVVIGLWLLLSEGFISLWCVWAAVTSVVIAVEIRATSESRSPHRSVLA